MLLISQQRLAVRAPRQAVLRSPSVSFRDSRPVRQKARLRNNPRERRGRQAEHRPSEWLTRVGAGSSLSSMSTRRSYRVLTQDGHGSGPDTSYLFDEGVARRFMEGRRRPGRVQRLVAADGKEIVVIADPAQIALDLQWPASDAVPRSTAPFVPAENKLEAVTRLARLAARGPETLGPGSKERKSVLIKLAQAFALDVDTTLAKPQLGGAIAQRLDAQWGPECWSTGSTLTLQGLNVLLESAQHRLAGRGAACGDAQFESLEAEAGAVLDVLAAELCTRFDGRTCVDEMRRAGYSQWAQDEWAGFFVEYRGLPALVSKLGGGPVKYNNTRFDYALRSAWDLKCHAAAALDAPLNDVSATRACLQERPLGFVVLSGRYEYDDGDFRSWFRDERVRNGKTPVRRQSPAQYTRRSKVAFVPSSLEAFLVPDLPALDEALRTGAVDVLQQGRQTSGAPRPPKYRLRLSRARQALRVGDRHLAEVA